MRSRVTKHTEAQGRAMAVKMLAKVDYGSDQSSIRAMFRKAGTPQNNFVLRNMQAIHKSGSLELLAGFCAVLTDYLQHESDWLDLSYYEELTERDITGKPGPWPTMDDEYNARAAEFGRFMEAATCVSAPADPRASE